jgi:hypothetical protein
MASDLKKELTDRFVKGIRKSFMPCPLIGPKWLQAYPNGKPADFRFFGVRKLAKAIGRPPGTIVQILMKNVNLNGLDVDVEIKQGVLLDINRRDKAGQGKGAKVASGGKPGPGGKGPTKPPRRPPSPRQKPARSAQVHAGVGGDKPDNWGNR